MRLLIAFLFAVTASAQLPPPLPNDSRVPPNYVPNPQRPQAVPKVPTVPAAYYGDVRVPITKAEATSHQIVWKHIVRRFPPNRLNPRSLTVWITNVTHPISDGLGLHLKDGEPYDPRNLHVTTRYLSFDAPAGDYILWRVGGTPLP
jgi:hypothetical protein